MNNLGKNLALWIIIGLLLVALFNLFQNSTGPSSAAPIAYSEFLQAVGDGRVSDVTIEGRQITGHYDGGRGFSTYAPDDPALVDRLNENGVRISASPDEQGMPGLLSILVSWFPMLLLIAVWIFFMRQMQGGGGKAMGFGKSKAKLLTERQGRVTFDDVAGVDEAKSELEEIVEFLKDPQKFQRLGGKIPKGVLLVGPPGTGKTLIARAVAGEANVPFFTISGSDFVEMFVGVGASRVRDMFEQGKKNAPCIIFIDEIDAVGRHRGAGLGGGNDEREQTLNQLLVEMDGFEANEGVILIAATNRPDVLDPALLRPGRFDRQVVVPNPDIVGRTKILKVHMRKVPLANDVDPKVIARGTPGFSGADLANLVNEAALMAARAGKRVVGMDEFEGARDKVMMGAERRSMVLSDDEKELTAWHEAAHAVVALHLPSADPIHKATIVPRGRALGLVQRLPEADRYAYSKEWCQTSLAIAVAGRLGEEILLGPDKITNGAASDIQMATRLATDMVTKWGMSDRLGMLQYAAPEQEVFLGHSVTQHKTMSEATAKIVDEEIRLLIDNAVETANRILDEHREDLENVARGLLEFETLNGDELRQILRGEAVVRPEPEDMPPPPPRMRKPTGRRSSVPTGGKTGIGPEPQPGT